MKAMFQPVKGKSYSEFMNELNSQKEALLPAIKKWTPIVAGGATATAFGVAAIVNAANLTNVVPVAAGAAANGTKVIAFKTVEASVASKIFAGIFGVAGAVIVGGLVYVFVEGAINGFKEDELIKSE